MSIEIRIYSDNNVFDRTITYDYIVKKLIQKDQLNSGLDSSSSTRQFSILKTYPYLMDILSWNGTGDSTDLHVHIYNTDTTPATNIFTGYLSDKINWGIDSHGADVLTLTAEDMGTHLLKNPYTKNESKLISGTFSQCLTSICTVAGISLASNIPTSSTPVSCIAEAAESCESLLKALVKEFGYAYYFQADGKMNLKALSSDDLTSIPVIYDNELYDSIQLVKKASQYRGSRVTWKKLATRANALIYRDITNQSTSHPNCWIELNVNESWPASTATAIKATDLMKGSEVYAITSVTPDVTWERGSGTDSIVQYGADSIKVLETCTSAGGYTKGVISKLQATAALTYVESTETVYGETDYTSENLYEAECRWIHSQTPAETYANFCAQYWQYSSNTFTFKTKRDFSLGQIIRLNENIFTGLAVYLMIQDIKSDGTTDVKTYTAVSTSEFEYDRHTDNESMYIPPSDTYVTEMPDVIESTSLTISPLRSTLIKNLRSSGYQTLGVKAFITGGTISGITLTAAYSDGTAIPAANIHVVTADSEWTVDVLINKDVEAVNLVMTAGTIEERASVSFVDETQYYKFLGNYPAHPTDSDIPLDIRIILKGDFYVRYDSTHTTPDSDDGKTFECTNRSGSTLTWAEMALTNAENANKFLTALESATRNGIPLEDMSNPNTVSWFNTIIAAKAVIDSLFSRSITLLDPGHIRSSNYAPASEGDVCTYELTDVNPDYFSLDEDTFISHFSGVYGTYRFVCTYATHDPHHSGGDDEGEWALYQNGTVIAIDLEDADLLTYGVRIGFDGEAYTVSVGDEFNIIYSYQTVPGRGFYLGSDGTFDCNNATANRLTITGDSVFNGSFNCDVIKTVAQEGAYTDLTGVGTGPAQAKRIADRLITAGIIPDYAGPLYTSNYLPVGVTGASDIKYIKVKTQTGAYSGTYHASVYFYNESFTELDIRNYFSSFVTGGNKVRYLWSSSDNQSREFHGMWVEDGRGLTDGISIRVYTGGNALELNIPDQYHASGLTSNQLFYGTQTTVNNIPCYPIYLKA